MNVIKPSLSGAPLNVTLPATAIRCGALSQPAMNVRETNAETKINRFMSFEQLVSIKFQHPMTPRRRLEVKITDLEVADWLPSKARAERPPGGQVDAVGDEANRAVAQGDVETARVPAARHLHARARGG